MASHWRIWLVRQMDRMSRALDFFSVGVLRPEDIIEWNRRYYSTPGVVASFDHTTDEGLYPEEETVVDRLAEAILLSEVYWVYLAASGPMTVRGRTRAAMQGYLQAVDRVSRLASQIGLQRRARKVPTLDEYLHRRAAAKTQETDA